MEHKATRSKTVGFARFGITKPTQFTKRTIGAAANRPIVSFLNGKRTLGMA